MKKTLCILGGIFITQSVLAEPSCTFDLNKYYANYQINTYNCNPGYYLPANTDGCRDCPTNYTCSGGTYTFNETEDQGAILSSFTCASGYYLPANTYGCVACLNGFTCPGGTFDFNPDEFQGLSFIAVPGSTMNNICATNFPKKLGAIYIPNIHNCGAGYYLPANVDECTICPQNSICSGGTYSFNETIDQGKQSCSANNYSPTGSTVCYPHILHVGDNNIYLRSTKLTTPSVNIKIGNDIFYANMTTTPTFMNKSSIRYLRVKYNNTDYYVCDDTTCPQ